MTVIQAWTIAGLVTLATVIAFAAFYGWYYGARARRFGYLTRRAYMRAVPRSDEERREAVDQALKGLALCFVGVVFFPLLLIGIFPLYVGGRKVACALLGLGLLDDVESRSS